MGAGLGATTWRISDIGGSVPPLWAFMFRAAAGNATLTGFFIDIDGRQIGAAFTGTVDSTPRTLCGPTASAVLALDDLPPGAVGFRGRLSADVILAYGGTPEKIPDPGIAAQMSASPTLYPLVSATDDFSLGRVG